MKDFLAFLIALVLFCIGLTVVVMVGESMLEKKVEDTPTSVVTSTFSKVATYTVATSTMVVSFPINCSVNLNYSGTTTSFNHFKVECPRSF
jgi:divalent metal cation (Fe/Co/Zn/Cd) transporter